MFSDEIENKLEHWDLFRQDTVLFAGKSWPNTMKGKIAQCIISEPRWGVRDKPYIIWEVRSIDSFEVGWDDNENRPTIEWFYTFTNVENDKFVEYMDHLREVVTHLKLAEHEMQLGFDLEENV